MFETRGRPPFVLVHGAFHGGWCFKAVARLLREAGHEVYTPTQTGLGERRHLLASTISMETFVLDVANLIEFEDLRDVVLVGHSYGGRSVSGVADRMPERIRRLVFLDSGLSPDGRSRLEAMPEDQRNERIRSSMEFDGGVSVPPPSATRFGVTDPGQVAYVDKFMTPQPLGAERTGLPLRNPLGNGLPVTYVQSVAPVFPVSVAGATYAKTQPGWRFLEFQGGHNAIVTHPQEMARLLLNEAGLEA